MKEYETIDFAYWVGLVQSDGSFRKKVYGKKISYLICFAAKDRILVESFQKISADFLNRHAKIFNRSNQDIWFCEIGVARLLDLFKSLDIKFTDPPAPPKWIKQNLELFGAYLAGVIDGDGNVRIKRPKYPQCAIRISSGTPQIELRNSIIELLGCSAWITKKQKRALFKKENRIIEGTSYDLEFLVSSKTIKFIKSFVLPYVQLDRKSEKLESFILSKII